MRMQSLPSNFLTKEFVMQKFPRLPFALLIFAVVTLVPAGARADNERGNFSLAMFQWGGGIEPHINHLNRMVGQVRWQLSRYHGDTSVRRDFANIRRDVDRVNWVYKNGTYDRRQLRAEIDGLHARLHELEVRMHVRTSDYYSWR
jgi:hypothetical protein